MQQPDGVVGGVIGTEGIGANQLGETVGAVGLGHTVGAHLVQDHAHAGGGGLLKAGDRRDIIATYGVDDDAVATTLRKGVELLGRGGQTDGTTRRQEKTRAADEADAAKQAKGKGAKAEGGADAPTAEAESEAAGPDAPPSDDLLRGVAAALKAWPWGRRPTWVTWVPSRRRPLLVAGLAERLAEVGKMELVEAVHRVRADADPQARMDNSATQAANVLDAFTYGRADGEPLPSGPGLLIDDAARSGWTLAVAAEGLRSAGSGLVLPFVLWRRP